MLILWSLVMLSAIPSASPTQSCNPAVVSYLVRDENGKIVSEADLKSIFKQLPDTISDASVDLEQVSFAADLNTYYWPEDTQWPKGIKRPALQFANAATCTLHLTEVSLAYHGKKMRVIFNLDIARSQSDRRPVIDSLPFQEGTFSLDMSGWSRDIDKLIPAQRWKKVSNRPKTLTELFDHQSSLAMYFRTCLMEVTAYEPSALWMGM
jgi:hypothetical protein